MEWNEVNSIRGHPTRFWSLSEKHSIYIELLLQKLLLSSRLQECSLSLSHILIFIRVIEHRKHFWASKAFFQKCSLSLSHLFLYIFIRIIEHSKSFRKSCHSKDLNLSFIQNDRIYFITYYFLRLDDRLLIIQQKRCSA